MFAIQLNLSHVSCSAVRLTSFVVLSFKQAEPYIFIDDAVLAKALTWLITETYDERTSTFREVGNVLHEAMQVLPSILALRLLAQYKL